MKVVFLFLALWTTVESQDFLTVYMEKKQGSTYSAQSIRLETTLARMYTANTNAWVVLTTSAQFPLFHINFRRFELEKKYINGSCLDYFNIYDGNSLSSSRLNPEPLCGNSLTVKTYETKGRYLTAQFVTDATAEMTGVELIATSMIKGKCTDTNQQFQCTDNTMCISRTLLCDGFSHCMDESDEDASTCKAIAEAINSRLYGIVIGSVVGGSAFIIIVTFLICFFVREHKYKRLLHQLRLQRKKKAAKVGPVVVNEYPVTNAYRKREFKQMFRDEDIIDKDWGLYQGPLYEPQHLKKVAQMQEKMAKEKSSEEENPQTSEGVEETPAQEAEVAQESNSVQESEKAPQESNLVQENEKAPEESKTEEAGGNENVPREESDKTEETKV